MPGFTLPTPNPGGFPQFADTRFQRNPRHVLCQIQARIFAQITYTKSHTILSVCWDKVSKKFPSSPIPDHRCFVFISNKTQRICSVCWYQGLGNPSVAQHQIPEDYLILPALKRRRYAQFVFPNPRGFPQFAYIISQRISSICPPPNPKEFVQLFYPKPGKFSPVGRRQVSKYFLSLLRLGSRISSVCWHKVLEDSSLCCH